MVPTSASHERPSAVRWHVGQSTPVGLDGACHNNSVPRSLSLQSVKSYGGERRKRRSSRLFLWDCLVLCGLIDHMHFFFALSTFFQVLKLPDEKYFRRTAVYGRSDRPQRRRSAARNLPGDAQKDPRDPSVPLDAFVSKLRSRPQ